MTTPTPPSAMVNDLSYGELLRLTEGHGTSEIYARIARVLSERDERLAGLKRANTAALDALQATTEDAIRFQDQLREREREMERLREALEYAANALMLTRRPAPEKSA